MRCSGPASRLSIAAVTSDVFGILWLIYFGFQLASFVISTLLKLWQVFKGKHKRYSAALLAEEVLGGVLNVLALVGLWAFIHSLRLGSMLGAQELWLLVFWTFAALLLIQPMLPKSKLIYAKGGANPTLLTWLFMLLWTMPMLWALWVYAYSLPEMF